MDIPKVFTLLCAFMLIICIVLTVTCAMILKNTVEETEKWQLRTQNILDSVEVFQNNNALNGDTQTEPPTKEDCPSTEADILYNKFYIREENGKIAIYCDEGQLIRVLDVPVKLLSSKDQKKLREGIRVNSWNELIALIQDYE